MQEVVITFETAKLAYEKGFHHMKANIYGDNLHYHRDDPEGVASALNTNIVIGTYLAPTQSLLQKWLRDVHQKYIGVPFAIWTNKKYRWNVSYIDENGTVKDEIPTDEWYDTHEEALEVALQKALKLLEDESNT